MKLFLLLLLWSTSTEGSTNATGDINIRIGAGYGVGLDDGLRLPKSTTKVLHSTTNALSEILSREVQHRRPKTVVEPEPAESVHDVQMGHNMRDIQRIVDGLERDKYSKIVQVVKVPAVYEIHLQTDLKEKAKPKGNQRARKVPRYPKVRYNRDQRESSPGKKESLRGPHAERHFRPGRNPPRANKVLQRKTTPEVFTHNQQIMDPEHPPQAMYEVPAPSLGDNLQHHWNHNQQLDWTNTQKTTNPKNHQLDWSHDGVNAKNARDYKLSQLEWNQATSSNSNAEPHLHNQPLSWDHATTNDFNLNNHKVNNWNTNVLKDPNLKNQQLDWSHDIVNAKNGREYNVGQVEWNQAASSSSIAEPNLNNQPLSWNHATTNDFNLNNHKLNWNTNVVREPNLNNNQHDLEYASTNTRDSILNNQPLNLSVASADVMGDPKSQHPQPVWSLVDTTAHDPTQPTLTDQQLGWNHQPSNHQPMWSSTDPRDPMVPSDRPSSVWNSVNLYSTLTPAVPYERTSNDNLVYGRAFEPVMAPALLAADPGSPGRPERRRDNGVDVNRVSFTTERSRGGGFSDRVSRRSKESRPVGYSIYTRISERYIDGSDRR